MYKTPTFEERFEYKEKNKALDKEILEIDKKLPVENWSLGMKESFILGYKLCKEHNNDR
jgi:hypothetical protein